VGSVKLFIDSQAEASHQNSGRMIANWKYATTMAQIYERPDDYDLEHLEDDADIHFYCDLIQRLNASSVVELGCGTGRISVPIAETFGKGDSFVVGIDFSRKMLEKARMRLDRCASSVRTRVQLVEADMRTWRSERQVDVTIVPCSSISHLLSLGDQLQLWRTTHDNLKDGGRFVVEAPMPNLAVLAESQNKPSRAITELDRDVTSEDDKSRLLRHKTTWYAAHQQRAAIRFLYEHFEDNVSVTRYIDDFASHVYFPRELELLYMHTGYEIESIFGDYGARPLGSSSQMMIVIGRKSSRARYAAG
jgi:SAM-dependent methyltransferase